MTDPIPLFDAAARSAGRREALTEAFRRVLDSGHYVLGREAEALEQAVASRCGGGTAIAMSSGSDAILAAVVAAGAGPGDEIVTTPFTFIATAGSIARAGARPVFADIDRNTMTLDPELAVAAATDRTRGFMPVHLFGRCAELHHLTSWAQPVGVAVIEDAAQAFGATDVQGRPVGSLGDAACLSFYPTKTLGGYGEGGMVVTRRPGLARTLRELRNHGARAPGGDGGALGSDANAGGYARLGGNFRMDELQAALLREELRGFDVAVARRRLAAGRYLDLFGDLARDLPIRLPRDPGAPSACGSATDAPLPGRHVFGQFVIRTPERDALRSHLETRGIGTGVYYRRPLHLEECFAYLGHKRGEFPEAEAAAREALALPLWPEITAARQERVVAACAEFFAGNG